MIAFLCLFFDSITNTRGIDMISEGMKVEYLIERNQLKILEYFPSNNSSEKKLIIPPTVKIHKKTFPIVTLESFSFRNIDYSEIFLPSTIFSIKQYAFANAKNLTKVDLSKTKIKQLSNGIFENCEMLTEVIFPHGLNTISKKAFSLTNISSLQLPCSIQHIHGGAFLYCKNVNNITIDGENKFFSIIDNNTIIQKSKRILVLAQCTEKWYNISNDILTIGPNALYLPNLKVLTIPTSIKTICSEAFMGCPMLEEIKFESSCLVELKTKAFTGVNLRYIKLPPSLKSLASFTFANSTIKVIDISSTKITELPSNAFSDVSDNEEIWLPIQISFIPDNFLSGTNPRRVIYCGTFIFNPKSIPNATEVTCDKTEDPYYRIMFSYL